MECRMREIVAEGVGLREMGAFEAASETAGARGEVFGTMRQGAARWSETVDARVPECGKTAGIMARGPHRALDVALFFFHPRGLRARTGIRPGNPRVPGAGSSQGRALGHCRGVVGDCVRQLADC